MHRFFFLVSLVVWPQMLYGWSDAVVGVVEGDLIKARHKGRIEQVRLYGVDCPDLQQVGGQKARRYTASVAEGKQAKIRPVTRDNKGHIIAMVWVNGHLLNQVLIREGFARVDKGNCGQAICEDWLRYESWARNRGKGLWGAPLAVPRR